MAYIEVRNSRASEPVKLYYEDLGTGDPVVLIHGWPLSHEMWEYQLTELVEAGFRVIAYDRRGFGKSSRPYASYDYDTLTDDLQSLLGALDLHNVTLVGFSMGGGEVVRYFSRYGGERVSRAVLIGAVTPRMLKADDNPEGVDDSVFKEIVSNIKQDRIGFLDTFGKQFFGVNLINKPVSTPLLEYYRMLAAFASPVATVECARAFAYTDFTEEMKSVNVPTLIIHGASDKTVPIDATGEKSAKLIQGSKYVKYDGAPHGLFYTDRERLNQDLITFIRETSDAGTGGRNHERVPRQESYQRPDRFPPSGSNDYQEIGSLDYDERRFPESGAVRDQRGLHSGKGSKSYKRSDDRLREVVCDRLCDDPFVDASNIDVHVKDGEVILEGSVADEQSKRRAGEILHGIMGANRIENKLTIGEEEVSHEENITAETLRQ